ncbi:hypothetical protein L3X39_02135 [Sabulilitoribacter multivorans]|uniref:Exonuclease VII large subunit C-terminal domain-containing protein n=1 Tax=Flaviramulus multivorans TaxID=1304750 RepID=A0ABS9IGY3_9FLAO|nr:exodeoxyribonuclease VII large subunit [Flaviramulus multivorans]MCF7559420.1 hypothetical protein [Flaviramulus multivorans]
MLIENKITKITVTTLQALYSSSLSSTLDGKLLILEGFYFHRNGRLYNKYYYDEIVSKDKQNKITAQITPSLRKQLVEGEYFQYEGFVNKTQGLSKDSTLNVLFTVSKIVKHEEEVQLISKVEYDVFQARYERDIPLITDLLLEKIQSGKKPILDVITGVQSTSKDDYLAQLPDFIYYEIRHHKCSLSSKADLIRLMKSYDFKGSDLVVILRGGGSGLEVFNEIDLCKKALELPVPFITGIGHDADKTLLEKVADRGFSTPTAVGAFLQQTINVYKNRLKSIKAKDDELIQLKKQAENEKLLLSNQITSQKRNLNVIWIVLIALIVIIGALLFKIIA